MKSNYIVNFVLIWISVISGGLISLYVTKKYSNLTEFSNIKSSILIDLSLTSFFILFQVLLIVLFIYFIVKVGVESIQIFGDYLLSPLQLLIPKLIMQDKETTEKERGFYERRYLPNKHKWNFWLSIGFMTFLTVFWVTFFKEILEKKLTAFVIITELGLLYSVYHSLIYVYESRINSYKHSKLPLPRNK